MTNPALYQMNPQGRFSDRAPDYAKYRPSYPSTACDRKGLVYLQYNTSVYLASF